MPTIQPFDNYLEYGTGATANAGRGSANINKLGFDTNGYMYIMKRNVDGTSRAAGVPTILDLTDTKAANQGAGCIQPAASLFHMFAGVWASTVGASTASGAETDWQWVQYYGSYSAVPVNSANSISHAASGTVSFYGMSAAADSFDAATVTKANQELYNGRGGWPLAGSVASSASTVNMWFNMGPL